MGTLRDRWSALRSSFVVAASLALCAAPLLAHGGAIPTPKNNGAKGPGVIAPAGPLGKPGAGPITGAGPAPSRRPRPKSGAATWPPESSVPTPKRTRASNRGSTRDRNRGNDPITGASNSGADLLAGPSAFDAWEFWWETNNDRFLDLKRHTDAQHRSSGSPGFLTGRGTRHMNSSSRGVVRELTKQRVVPRLLQLLDEAEHPDVLSSTLIALARCAEGDQRGQVLARAQRLLAHHVLDVRASAALSIGMLGTTRASRLLADVLLDTSHGRVAVGGGKPDDLVRAYAALALGMLGNDRAVDALRRAALELRDGEREVKSAAFTALGLLDAEHPRAAEVRALLEDQLLAFSLDDGLRATTALSLGRLGRRESLPLLVEALGATQTKNDVRRSCAIALGMLAELDDELAVDALYDTLDDESDAATRHFTLIALGEIGGRDARSELHRDRHARLRDRLQHELEGDGRSRRHQSWAAIASALYARGQPDAEPELRRAVRAVFDSEHAPSLRGACALALGLMGDAESGTRILDQWIDMKDASFRGYAALALGFLGEPRALDALREVLLDRTTPAELRRKVATSLGLMRDRSASAVLVETLRQARDPEVFASATRGLGLLGSAESLEPLLELATAEREQEQVRAFASVALGLAGERTPLPWNEPLRAHANYLLTFQSLIEVRDLF